MIAGADERSLFRQVLLRGAIGTDNMSRDEEIKWLQARGIETEYTVDRPYSVDQNLWGRSICAGILEDVAVPAPEHVYAWTRAVLDTPNQPQDVAIEFEDRVVGIKTRELYEAPAAVILVAAHRALESLTLSRKALAFKRTVEQEYSEIAYEGDWFSQHHLDLLAYLQCSQRPVHGEISMRLFKGNWTILTRKSALILYRPSLATYSSASVFDQRAAAGFRHIAAVEKVIAAEQYLLAGAVEKEVYQLAGRAGKGESGTE